MISKGFKSVLELRSSKIKHQQQKKLEITQLTINNLSNQLNTQVVVDQVKPPSIHISIKPPVPVQNISRPNSSTNKERDVDNSNNSNQQNVPYKLHYGFSNTISPKILVNSNVKPQVNVLNTTNPLLTTNTEVKRPHSASSTRIHRVISDSQRYIPDSNNPTTEPQIYNPVNHSKPKTETTESKLPNINAVDNDNDLDEESANDNENNNLQTEKRDEKTLLDRPDNTIDNEYDDDMDGKIFSRSHPEVSTTTPSQSIDLNGQITNIDIRNSSIDSMNDDNIDLGLSTLPNQFCNKKDASELKKLILFSNNNHAGGMVPSSSAVMDMYMVGKVIGIGSYGKVRAAWHRLTSSKVAIKTYDKSKMKDSTHWKRVYSEIKIMEQLSHPRISRLYEAIETPKRVTHRDIKLENVLFTNSNANNTNTNTSDIKLIDFGFSTVCQPGKRLKVFCGTPSYMAPEIVRRQEYEGKSIDMWSLGILLYALLCGCFPFRAKSYPDLYRRIARGIFTIPEELSAPRMQHYVTRGYKYNYHML
eukprot:gene20996-27209_t